MSDPVPDPTADATRISGRDVARVLLLGALIGIPAAAVALALFGLVHVLQHALWTDLPASLGASAPPWYLVLGLPVIGALVVAAARILLPGDGGASPLAGISHGPTPVRYAAGVALAAVGTLGFGLVLGPEAPVIALGSAVGLAVTALVRFDANTAVMANAGSFSAISALFGGPLVAGVMLTEAGVGLGARITAVLLPGFVAAAVGYLIFVGVGPAIGLPPPGLVVPDLEPIVGISLVDLAAAVGVGIATALVIGLVHRGARALDAADRRRFGESRTALVTVLVLGGLAVGLLALGAAQLGVSSQDVLFSGQASIPALVATPTIAALVVLTVAKALGYIISLATGFRGGGIFPAIFLGIGLATFAVQWLDISPTLAIAIGSAAGMVAASRLVLTSMLFSSLLVGTAGAEAIPATVFATVSAYLTVRALEARQGPPTG